MNLPSNFQWPIVFLAFSIFFCIFFRKEISEFLKEISWLKTKWFELRRIREEVFAKAEEVKKLSDELNKDKSELREATRIFIESFYLTLQTRNIFPIPEPIAKEIGRNLNILANFAVEDAVKRSEWIKNIEKLLAQKT